MNTSTGARPAAPRAVGVSGRHVLLFAGRECGEERWSLLPPAQHDLGGEWLAMGEQVLEAPHPLAGSMEYRVKLSENWRVRALEIAWTVGGRALRATHGAAGDRWRARIDYAGHVREQEGDYPALCEIGFGSPMFTTFALRHYVIEPGATHSYPSLFIGPPYMAVEPGHEQLHCDDARELETAFGRVQARRIVSTRVPGGEGEGMTLWTDEHDIVLEAHVGADRPDPWVRLVEYRRGIDTRRGTHA